MFNAFLSRSGELFANAYISGFLHAALWFNQGLVPSGNSSTHCKPTLQTYCGLTNCTDNSPETGFTFSFWRLV